MHNTQKIFLWNVSIKTTSVGSKMRLSCTEHFFGQWLTNFLSSLQNGCTSLYIAAQYGHTEAAKALLEANADVKAVTKVRSGGWGCVMILRVRVQGFAVLCLYCDCIKYCVGVHGRDVRLKQYVLL